MLKYLTSILVLAALLGGCTTNNIPIDTIIAGSGSIITETRPVQDFDQVILNGLGNLNVELGDTESLTIKTDDNIMPLIRTEVSAGRLVIDLNIRPNEMVEPSRAIAYTLTVKDIRALELNGAGNITSGSIDAESLSVFLSGAGNVTLGGHLISQNVTIKGSGTYNAGDLQTERTMVTIEGAGNVTVWAQDNLDAQISGLGNVVYYGNPAVRQDVSGVGTVTGLGAK